MNEKISALYSDYVIDGITQDLTPDRMLSACLETPSQIVPEMIFSPVIDESIDPALKPCVTDASRINEYAEQVKSLRHHVFPVAFPETYTKSRIAVALIDTIWKEGHFRLDDLSLELDWKWNPRKIGDMTAFYSSVYSAADYSDSLGLKLSGYSYSDAEGESGLEVSTGIAAGRSSDEDDDFFGDLPFRTEHPRLADTLLHPSELVPDTQSWLIYIPFENSEYRLGASLLAQVLGVSGAVAPQIVDADYFIDCYEVVRELVEDGIVLSGVTSGEGGLMSALNRMAEGGTGLSVDLSGLARATGEPDIVRLLFSEVPGVVIQIADIDYDYVDAELLLQDVAFFPLGHPVSGQAGVEVRSSDRTGIQNILESLIRSQSPEGED